MADYCVPGDLYKHGVPRGAVPNPGRLAASVLASTDAFSLDEHGFDADDPIQLRAIAGGVLPAPLAAGATYYVQPIDEYSFKVAAAPAGAAIDLTSDGDSVLVLAPLPTADAIAWASRIIDDMLPAHVVPLVAPYPPIVVMTCAELAAGHLADGKGAVSATLTALVDAAQKRIARWGEGIPIRGQNSPARAGLSASSAGSGVSGWKKYGGI